MVTVQQISRQVSPEYRITWDILHQDYSCTQELGSTTAICARSPRVAEIDLKAHRRGKFPANNSRPN